MYRFHLDFRRLLHSAPALAVGALACAAPVFAQDLFVPSDRTIANGNPISGYYDSISIGYDSAFTPYAGVKADFTGGYTQSYFVGPAALSIYGGTLGDGYAFYSNGSINLYGGNIGTDNGIHLFGGSQLNVYGKHLNVYDLSYYNPGDAGRFLLTGDLQNGYDLHTHFDPYSGSLSFNGLATALPTTPAFFLNRSYTTAGGNPINDSGIFAIGVDSSFVKRQGVQVDVVGGYYERLDGYSDSALSFQNGYASQIAAYDATSVTVTGGQVDATNSYGASIVNLNGGANIGTASAYDASVTNINSEANVNVVNSRDSSAVNVNAGAVVFGGVNSYDTSTLNLSGDTYLGYSNPNGYSANSYNASVINFNGSNSYNGIGIFTHDASALNVNNGYLGGLTVADSSVANINSLSGASITGVGNVGVEYNGTVNLNGGYVNNVWITESGTFNINNAGESDSITSHGAGQINLNATVYGSTFNDSVHASVIQGYDSSAVRLKYARADYIDAHDDSATDITASYVENLSAYDNSIVDIRDGDLHNDGVGYYNVGSLDGYNNSVINVSDEGGIYAASLHDSSVLTIENGAIHSADAYGNSAVHFNGSGFYATSLASHDASTIDIQDGFVRDVYGYNNGVISMYGGSIASFFGFDSSVFNLYGGIVGFHTINLLNFSTTRLYGTGLTLSSALGDGSDANGLYTDYLLTGFLSSGDALDTHLHYYGNGASLYFNDAAIISGTAAAPEPGTLALIVPLLGGAMFVARRRAQIQK